VKNAKNAWKNLPTFGADEAEARVTGAGLLADGTINRSRD